MAILAVDYAPTIVLPTPGCDVRRISDICVGYDAYGGPVRMTARLHVIINLEKYLDRFGKDLNPALAKVPTIHGPGEALPT